MVSVFKKSQTSQEDIHLNTFQLSVTYGQIYRVMQRRNRKDNDLPRQIREFSKQKIYLRWLLRDESRKQRKNQIIPSNNYHAHACQSLLHALH